MKLQQDDRKALVAAAKWQLVHVFIPAQDGQANEKLEAMKQSARRTGMRYKTEQRTIRVGGKVVRCVVLLMGSKRPVLVVTVVIGQTSYELLSKGPKDKAEKAGWLAGLGEAHELLSVAGRRHWPTWLLSVEGPRVR